MKDDELLIGPDGHSSSFKKRMNSLSPGILDNLEALPQLDPALAEKVYQSLMEMACQAQSWIAIITGQSCLRRIPLEWLRPRLQKTLEEYLLLNDSYEFHRLADLYQLLQEPIPAQLQNKLDLDI